MKYFISFIAGFVACIIFITSILKKVEKLINILWKYKPLEIILCDDLIPSFKKFIVSSVEYLLYGSTPSSEYRYNTRGFNDEHRVTYYRPYYREENKK